MIWMMSLATQPLTLMLLKFLRRCNFPDPSILQNLPGDNIESGIASIDPSNAIVSGEFACPDDYFDAPEDQIRCVPSLDHAVAETFDPY
jgi:hypothetical protein